MSMQVSLCLSVPFRDSKKMGRKRKCPVSDESAPQEATPQAQPTPPPPSDWAVSDFVKRKWEKSYEALEEETRGQADVELWHQMRFGRITGTSVSDILSAARQSLRQKSVSSVGAEEEKKTAYELYLTKQFTKVAQRMSQKITGIKAKNEAPISKMSCIKYGRENEARAREVYTRHIKAFDPEAQVVETGFICGKYAGCGCSPDGIATFHGRKYLLEIKCPATLRYLGLRGKRMVTKTRYMKVKRGQPELRMVQVEMEMPKYFSIPQPETQVAGITVLALDKSANRQATQYDEQVQFNMLMTGLDCTHLFIYTEKECGLIVIPYDESFTQNLDIFYRYWQEFLVPRIIKKGDYIALECDRVKVDPLTLECE